MWTIFDMMENRWWEKQQMFGWIENTARELEKKKKKWTQQKAKNTPDFRLRVRVADDSFDRICGKWFWQSVKQYETNTWKQRKERKWKQKRYIWLVVTTTSRINQCRACLCGFFLSFSVSFFYCCRYHRDAAVVFVVDVGGVDGVICPAQSSQYAWWMNDTYECGIRYWSIISIKINDHDL